MVPNRPTPEGVALGTQMARFADIAEKRQLKEFPDMQKRCGTCAFRLGTVANGCPPTLADAIKAITEKDMFACHEKPNREEPVNPCVGFMLLLSECRDVPVRHVPWEYSHIDDKKQST